MLTFDDQAAEWKRAYLVLDVPHHTSAHVIKDAYRRLVKRWHPDLIAPGTREHTEATQRTIAINQAYSTIAHAPLRYFPKVPTPARWKPQTNPRYGAAPRSASQDLRRADRIEFWVRFVCGALLGVCWTLGLILSEFQSDSLTSAFTIMLAVGALGLIVGCGLASARFGDKFWYGMFEKHHWDPL
jgi:DnaJ domain